jgi:hypothetical protein
LVSDLKFGTVDGDPFVRTSGEAWIFEDGGWKPGNPASLAMDGRPLSKAAFDAKFPSLPPPAKPSYRPIPMVEAPSIVPGK